MKIKYITITSLLFLVFSIQAFGQKKEIEINGVTFFVNQIKLESLAGTENLVLQLYRGNKKLITHTLFREEGDCSSTHIQLGKYKIVANKIVFYSYWTAADRMPGSNLPFGYRKQQYAVDSLGYLKLIDSKIYMENSVKSKNRNYFENNGWIHKGLKYLNQPTQNKYQQILVRDYTENIESEYRAKFVLNSKKDELEKEVRSNLKDEIKKNTQDWTKGEVYGNVKK